MSVTPDRHDAAARRLVRRKSDGRTGRIVFVPPSRWDNRGQRLRNRSYGSKARVELRRGAVISVALDDLELIEETTP